MSKTAILCLPDCLNVALDCILTAAGYRCKYCDLDRIEEQTEGMDSTDGVFCLWAEELCKKGSDRTVSWVTRLRIEKNKRWQRWPVIVVGYQPHIAFLRRLEVPRILASPGVEYIHLPCKIEHINRTINKAISPSDNEIQKYVSNYEHTKRLGDQLSHDLGNFYAMFRLLEGAYRNGEITYDDYLEVYCSILDIQKSNSKLNDDLVFNEFLYLRGSLGNAEPRHKADCSQPLAQGKRILLFDDAASLGWAYLMAFLLTGEKGKDPPVKSDENGVRSFEWATFTALGRADPFDESGEDEFVSSLGEVLKRKEGEKLINEADLIFLDLRLRRDKDEKAPVEYCSGVKILEIIRQVNAGVPLILLTASRKAKSLEIAVQKGADDYFLKDPGSSGERSEELTEYYQKFKDKILNGLKKAYLRDIWVGIENSSVKKDVKAYLKQAFALIRKVPSDFELSLSYTPYAAATVALGNALEKYIGWSPSASVQVKKRFLERFYPKNRESVTLALHLDFLRNNAAHPQSASVITELDARIAFWLALWSFSTFIGDQIRAQIILNVREASSAEVLKRKMLSYIRKKVNAYSNIPPFNNVTHFNDIRKVVDNDLQMSLLSLSMQSCFSDLGREHCEQVLLTSIFDRFAELVKQMEFFVPCYSEDERAMKPPRILEVVPTATGWELPDGSMFKPSDFSTYNHQWPPETIGHTQAFVCNNNGTFVPWGPAIPFGEYSESQIKEMLTL